MMRSSVAGLVVSLVVLIPAVAQQPASNTTSNQTKISRALAAGPANVTKDAKVVDIDKNGKETVLRNGTGEFICFPGHPDIVGDNPLCANRAALQWERDFAEHKPKPTNDQPGIEYMLLGGTDWSGDDPMANSGRPIKEPPHWMIMSPFDPKTTGLPIEPKQTGTWIMWVGTSWAHLMINQRP